MLSQSVRRPPKSAVLLAQRIVQDALRDGVDPGHLLLPEKSMMHRYEVGRSTLREALRLLEFQGVIQLKPGPHGGPVRLDPTASHLGSNLLLLMQLKSAPFRTVVEVRAALGPMISSLAAERISTDSLDELETIIHQMRARIEDDESFLNSNKRFHEIIARSSGNPLLGCLIASLSEIMDGAISGMEYPMYRRRSILAAHEQIFDALKAHDANACETLMRDLIASYDLYGQECHPEVMDNTVPWVHHF